MEPEWAAWASEPSHLDLQDGRRVYVVEGDGLLFVEDDDGVVAILDHKPERH